MKTEEAQIERSEIRFQGNTCSVGEAQAIEARISRLPGVVSVYANPAAEIVFVEYDRRLTGPTEFRQAIRDVGLKAA